MFGLVSLFFGHYSGIYNELLGIFFDTRRIGYGYLRMYCFYISYKNRHI